MPETGDSVIWITGSGGLIGTYLVATAAKTTVLQTGTPAALESRGPAARSGSGLRVVGLTRPILDLTDVAAVCERFRRDRPELIIHCAALTRAVLCEQDPALARKINVEVTRLLVDLAADVSFLFISTDLVFDGKTGWYQSLCRCGQLAQGERHEVYQRLSHQAKPHRQGPDPIWLTVPCAAWGRMGRG